MKLSEANVKRTWRYQKGLGMRFRMETQLGPGLDTIYAEVVVSDRDMYMMGTTMDEVDVRLKHMTMEVIRSALFPQS